jgi:tripartite-type tricarboxylate transporter receptor subunit TctC
MLMVTPTTRRCSMMAAMVATALTSQTGFAAESDKPVFDEKPIKIIVGMPVGGGVDAYARLVQKHIVRFLPGPPAVVVQNMPGAGSLRSVLAMVNSPPDEVTINTFSSSLISEAIAEPERVKVDFRRFAFVGNVAEDSRVCFVRSTLGPSTLQEIVKAPNPIAFGATAPGTSGNLDTAILRKLFGMKLRQVRGYPGSADKRIALERGEIDGDCAGITSIPEDWLKNHKIKMFVRMSPTLVPGIDASVPYAGDLLTDEMDRKIFTFLVAPQQLGRLFMVVDQTPANRLAALRKAFDGMVADSDFLADAHSRRLLVTPMAGAEVNRRVEALYKVSHDVLQKAREVNKD